MKIEGVPYRPRYSSDEIVVGLVVAFALHVAAVGPFFVKRKDGLTNPEDEKPLVSRPVVQATLLKFGKPIDPKRLPDRVVPQQRSAPKQQITASRDAAPTPPLKDAGAEPPPPNAQDSDLKNLIAKSDPFAEDAGRTRPEEGHPMGIDGGTETDPNKVRAGEQYIAQLGQFFAQRLTFPSTISVAEARRLCVLVQVNVGKNMVVWHVRQQPIIGSGNELFDDAARSMLLKLLDDKAALPTPPKELDEQFRGRTVQLVIQGDPHGDSRRCMPK